MLAENKLIDPAVDQLLQALRGDKTLYEPYVYLTRIYWGRKQYHLAEDTIARALREANVTSKVDLAQLYLGVREDRGKEEGKQNEELRKAIDELRYQCGLFPNDYPLHLYVAKVHLRYQDYKHAREIYGRLAGVLQGPVLAEWQVGMGRLEWLQNRDRAKATEHWRRAIQLDRNNREARELLQSMARMEQPPPEETPAEETTIEEPATEQTPPPTLAIDDISSTPATIIENQQVE